MFQPISEGHLPAASESSTRIGVWKWSSQGLSIASTIPELWTPLSYQWTEDTEQASSSKAR